VSERIDARRESTTRQFVAFAAITLIPVILLGFILAGSYQSEATRRGLAQGLSEAELMANTAVQPLLDGRPLSQGLSSLERSQLRRLASDAVSGGNVQRIRLRDLAGAVVFSDDGSGFNQRPEDEATDAARGTVIARLTQINTDSVDSGRVGPESVEVYLPLIAEATHSRVGVLEVYLPYAPIKADVNSGLHSLYWNLTIGLAALYFVLFCISLWVVRRLRRQVKRNAYLAEHDSLTDLPNRTLFHRRAKAELARGREHNRPTTIAIIDLDRFKEVNDTLGHQNGDRLLTAIGGRLASHLRSPDELARLGGDEFGIVLSNVANPGDILNRLREAIHREVELNGLPLSVEASIGYVVSPDEGFDIDELLQLADVAMYVAKSQHSGVVRYDKTQNRYDASNLSLVSELRQAMTSDELVLHYQPKLSIGSQRVTGVEALVRWNHPTHGHLSPDRFIPLVEQTDLIEELTAWVVARALDDLTLLGPANDQLTVAVNVSARNLGRIDFAGQVVDALQRACVSPNRLIVEVTETAVMNDPARAGLVLGEISRSGARVSIDDFGTGQTSLGLLAALPISELKIDRIFIADILENPTHAAIVQSIVELGHNLHLVVVGEGVESVEVLERLSITECDLAQGYLFARPMPIEELIPWLSGAAAQACLTE
jgi:diguanylate cyclase (GGDEF)-like protein